MGIRTILWLTAAGVSFAATPSAPQVERSWSRDASPVEISPPSASLTNEDFARLVRTDILAALQASLQRYKKEISGYRCVFLKQERVGGKWGSQEVIRATFRDDPFAVLFRWEKGGTASASLYRKGENQGKMQVLKTVPLLGDRIIELDPAGVLPRAESRYSITDFGLYAGCLRTFRKWSSVQKQGRLKVEYVETRPVEELGGRVCHLVRRTCDPVDIDPFLMDDSSERDPQQFPKEQIQNVIIMLDAETWQQVGSVLHHPDGKLLGTYFFKDIEVNPKLGASAFQLK